jgi:hypothetical protein
MAEHFIFENETGGVSLGTPTPEALALMPISAIAAKDTPEGKSFWLVDSTDLPIDHDFFNAWELDRTQLGDPYGKGTAKG